MSGNFVHHNSTSASGSVLFTCKKYATSRALWCAKLPVIFGPPMVDVGWMWGGCGVDVGLM